MKKSIKKVISILLIAVFMVSCFAISASAVTSSTKTYYPYQEKSYGSVTLTSNKISAKTYCEYKPAGKIAKGTYSYLKGNTISSSYVQKGGNYSNNTFSDTSSSTTVTASKSDTSITFLSAMSYHKVRVTSYILWDNAQCEGSTNGYDIPVVVL